MYLKLITLLAICYLGSYQNVNGAAIEPHTHPEIKIVDYSGKLTAESMSFFRGAEIFTMINSNITEVTGNIYKVLPKLKVVHLINNIYEKVEHETTLDGADSLQEAYVIKCSWKNPSLEIFKNAYGVKKIVIRGHKDPYGKIPANALNDTQLIHLELSSSGVEDFDDLAFKNLDKLEYLNLSGNKLKVIRKELLAPLESLKILDLSNNQIEKFTADNLPNLPNLEEINLEGNPLKTVDQTGFDKVAPKLKTFKVK